MYDATHFSSRRFAVSLLALMAPIAGCSAKEEAVDADGTEDHLEGDATDAGASPNSGRTIVDMASNGTSACAVRARGDVFCWGIDQHGELGYRPIPGMEVAADTIVPKKAVPGLDDAISLVPENFGWCALRRAGTVSCWGFDAGFHNGFGVFEKGGLVTVQNLTDATVLEGHCALRRTGKVACWDLGTGSEHNYKAIDIANLDQVVQLSAWSRDSACAVRADHRAFCFGYNLFDRTDSRIMVPGYSAVEVPELGEVDEIRNARAEACARRRNGHVVCWGYGGTGIGGYPGMFGGKAGNSLSQLHEVEGLTNAVRLAVGGGHAEAITADGRVLWWGKSLFTDSSPLSPVEVKMSQGLAIARIQISESANAYGEQHLCYTTKAGEAYCLGVANFPLWGTMDIGWTRVPERVRALDAIP